MAVPVLGSVTLPAIAAADGYSETLDYRGGFRRNASGGVVTQLVASAVKRKFRLTWPALTDAQKTTVISAFATVDDSSASFTAPTGTAYTVTRDPDSPGVSFDMFMIGGGSTRWRCSLFLEEA
jgi:hypothetical protein